MKTRRGGVLAALFLIIGCSGPTAPVPEMVLIPAGEFWMGADEGPADERPRHRVFLDAYSIDKYEVTVKEHAACVKAGGCRQPGVNKIESRRIQYCNWHGTGREDYPMNCLGWDQAAEYCRWADKRLPSEAQWEKAARGTDGRLYPWGDEKPSCELAIFDDGTPGCGKRASWLGGSRPRGASPYGLMDMAGNVWEWTADYYSQNYYKRSPQRNPKGPRRGKHRVQRGGSWYNEARFARAANRFGDPEHNRDGHVGFRCVKNEKVH